MAGCRFLDIASRLVFSHLQLAFIVTIAGSVSTSKVSLGLAWLRGHAEARTAHSMARRSVNLSQGPELSQVTTAWWYLVVIKIPSGYVKIAIENGHL